MLQRRNVGQMAPLASSRIVLYGVSLVIVAGWTPWIAAGVLATLLAGSAFGAVLYDQTDNASGNGAQEQDYEPMFDTYDSEGADDFVVTGTSGWDIDGVITVGTTGQGGSNSVSVTFYGDGGDQKPDPDNVLCSYVDLQPGVDYTDAGGSHTITLPTVCSIPGGTKAWVNVHTRQDFFASGQHLWSTRSATSFDGAVWRNPGNGFGTGCTEWTAMSSCGVGGGGDFLFQILGTEAEHGFQLIRQTLNAGGNPAGGSSLQSPSFTISLDSIGDAVIGSSMSIPLGGASFIVDHGFVAAFPPPEEVSNLLFTSNVTLQWTPEKSAGVYNLYRDLLGNMFPGFGNCDQQGLPSANATDSDPVPAGDGYFYLVTAENLLAEEGTKGFQSDRTERLGTVCP